MSWTDPCGNCGNHRAECRCENGYSSVRTIGNNASESSPINTLVRRTFIDRMKYELEDNKNKGDWATYQPQKMEVMSELLHHVTKLNNALDKEDEDAISEFSADIANIAMKISEIHGCA